MNADPAESDFEPVAWSILSDRFQRERIDQFDFEKQPVREEIGHPVFRWLLQLLLMLVLGESWLSWYQGRGRSTSTERAEENEYSTRAGIGS